MKFGFSNIVASAVLTAGLVSMSATGALANNGRGGGGSSGGGGNVAVCVDNLFAGLATDCKAQSGNDAETTVESLFNKQVIDGWNLDAYKVDSYEGTNNYFTIKETSEGFGTVDFKDDSTLANSTFAFVLKGGNGHAAYLFENIGLDNLKALENATFATGRPRWSHATLYVFDQPETPSPTEVPEPTALLGLIAVGGMLVGKKGLSHKS